MAQLVIVDDNDAIRSGIKAMLSPEEDLQIVGEASNGEEALELCREVRPNLALMDVRMPRMDGLTATREIKRRFPRISVLILTMHAAEEYLIEAIRAGAAGYILKEASQQDLASAIRRSLQGETTLSRDLAAKLLRRLIDESDGDEETAPRRGYAEPIPSLTPREIEVLELMSLGQTNPEIAGSLVISTGTAKTHVEHIITKLGASDRTQAVVRALEMRIITFPER